MLKKNLKKRILCLDFGTKRIGVAVSDELLLTAQGLGVLAKEENNWLRQLDDLVKSYDVGSFVIGLPLSLKGEVNEKVNFYKKMGIILEKRYSLPVFFWDERLSTVAAEKMLLKADISRMKRKKVRDKIAAVWILQGYLDSKRR